MVKRNKSQHQDDTIKALVQDPTRSVRDIAIKLGSYRQKVWRDKKRLEDNHIIWGYTAVVCESKLNHVVYIILLKMKPLNEETVKLMITRLKTKEPTRQKVRLLNVLLVNGEFDLLVIFSARDHATARRYFDSIRLAYDDILLEKPVIMDVDFTLVREGKTNPEIHKLSEFIPL